MTTSLEIVILLVYLAMTDFPRSYAPSILGPVTKGTIVSGGQYRRATHHRGRLSGEGELFATLRLITHTPAMWIRTGGTPGLHFLINTCNEHKNDYLVRDSHFACLPGDDLLSQELCSKYPWPWRS